MILKSKEQVKSAIACLIFIFCVISAIMVLHSGVIESSGHISGEVPILAYNINGNETSIQQIESDIKFLVNKGYSPVFASDVAESLSSDKKLPTKPIVLLFEGGYSSYYTQLFAILKKYYFKAVISVCGKQSELASNSADDNTTFLRWEQIQQLHDSGLVEISNETFSYHASNGFAQKENESYEDYQCRIIADIDRLQRLFADYCGFESTVFTYPDKAASYSSSRFVKDLGFKAGLILGNSAVSTVGINKSNELRIPCLARNTDKELSEILK